MSLRLWYPQLDVYDTVRRMLGFLNAWSGDTLTPERLYISDFYLANPELETRKNRWRFDGHDDSLMGNDHGVPWWIRSPCSV